MDVQCGTQDTVWSTSQDNTGACDKCPGGTRVPSEENARAWKCSSNSGRIAMDLSKSNDARTCSSFSTRASCSFKQKDLKGVQARLVSSGCDPLWVAPLWMVGPTWRDPQHATGEVDFFERGCERSSGYLASFGEGGGYVLSNAWNEGGKPSVNTDVTAYIEFSRQPDKVDTYTCPHGSNPASVGPIQANCTKTGTRTGYFADSAQQMQNGEALMHFVSDIWAQNDCPGVLCGAPQKKTSCKFEVRDFRVSFADNTNRFTDPEKCKVILADQNIPPEPAAPSGPNPSVLDLLREVWADHKIVVTGMIGLLVLFIFMR